MQPDRPDGLRVSTWNLHRLRGGDGRVDGARVAAAVEAAPPLARADILVLTEAEEMDPPYGAFPEIRALPVRIGMVTAHDLAGLRYGPASQGFRGTVVLLRPPLHAAAGQVVELGGIYPRAAILLDIDGGPAPLRLVATHLSLSQPLRIAQMRRIARALDNLAPRPVVVVGDLNEWRPWGGLALSRAIAGRVLHGAARRTFPARAPVLPLDRILCDRPGVVGPARPVRSDLIRAASDHLPLTAVLDLSATVPAASATARRRAG